MNLKNDWNGVGGVRSAAMRSEGWKRARKAVPFLTVLIPLSGLVSVISVAISMFSGEWLTSDERIPLESVNVTNRDEFRLKKTVSGLWTLCSCVSCDIWTETHLECFHIEYFSKERYTPEPHDSTNGICYAVTKAGPLFIVSSVTLTAAVLLALFGYCLRKCWITIFISGIIFIISGLTLLIGLVVYLSVIQSEIGPKLRPRNSLDSPQFVYHYGLGFILVVIGFMFTELTGTCEIFLYIYWHQLDWAKKAAGQPLVNGGSINSRPEPRQSPEVNSGQVHLHKIRCKRHGTFLAPAPTYSSSTLPGGLRRSKGCDHHVCRDSYFSYDDLSDLDVPFPPPPPPFPRDVTCTTTVSDYFYSDIPLRESRRKERKHIPV